MGRMFIKNNMILYVIFILLLIVNFFIVQASNEREIDSHQEKLMKSLIEIHVSRSDTEIERGRKKMKQAIADGADVNNFVHINKDTTWLPLTYAVGNTDLETCRSLIACKADVNGEDKLGSTPLMAALLFLRPDKVKLLFEHNADLQKKNSKEETAWDCIAIKEILFPEQEKRRKKIVDLIKRREMEQNN